MTNEPIIKKEDKLFYRGGFLKNKVGTLTLTPTGLSFATKKKTIFVIPMKDIVSANTRKGFGIGVYNLYVIYNQGGKETQAKIEHHSTFRGSFDSWEQAINDARLGKYAAGASGAISDLEKLAELKNKGVITEEEFAAKKKQILGL
jgi:hypothetical protein